VHARSTRFPLFDSLRAIAAVSVLAGHAAFTSQFDQSDNFLAPYTARLDVGVAIFFLISGFLLYRPFVAARMREQPGPRVAAYAWRRFLRIVPAYWLALTVIALWLALPLVFTAKGFLYFYGFAQIYDVKYVLGGIPQAWTLCVEVTFYAFLPLYALLMRSLPARTTRARYLTEIGGLVAMVAVAVAWQAWKVSLASDPNHANAVQGLTWLPTFLDHFALGMGLAVASVALAERHEAPRWLRSFDPFPALGWGLALVAFWVVSTQIGLSGKGGLEEHTTASQYFARHYLFGLVALGVLLPAVFGQQSRGLVRKLLARRELLYLGLVSYGIYLWHLVFFVQFDHWGLTRTGFGPVPGVLIWFLLGLACTTAVASLSYWLMERPLLRLKRLVPTKRPEPGEPIGPEPGPMPVEGALSAPPPGA
jgi:peptidoglycan/LPS O-acetylase OafA/YrhL